MFLTREKLTVDRFIKKSVEKHGNRFDYKLVSFIKNNSTKVRIICNKCNNVFLQTPDRHMTGDGCVYCSGKYQRNTLGFVKDAMQIHGFAFDYSEVNYVTMHTKVRIKHNKCGYVFEVKPGNHIIRKSGCPKCLGGVSISQEEFIARAIKTHGNKYDYSKACYKNGISKVIIYCKACKLDFIQGSSIHINGAGCPTCCESKGEREIARFLTDNSIDFIRQYGPDGCVNIKQLYFDFYLPVQNVLIEYDGEQHYRPIPHFGGINKYNKLKNRDNIKLNWSVSNDIKLYRIKYSDNLILELKNILNKEK